MRHKNPDAVTIPESAKSIVDVTHRLYKLKNRDKPPLIYHYMNATIEFAALTIQIKTDNGNNTNMIVLAAHQRLPTLAKCDIVKVMRNSPMDGNKGKKRNTSDPIW